MYQNIFYVTQSAAVVAIVIGLFVKFFRWKFYRRSRRNDRIDNELQELQEQIFKLSEKQHPVYPMRLRRRMRSLEAENLAINEQIKNAEKRISFIWETIHNMQSLNNLKK